MTPVLPQGIRRNTFSGSGEGGEREQQKPGERRETRGLDGFEALRQALGENFRDGDDAQRAGIATYPRELKNVYSEPLYLSLPSEPRVGIILARITKFPDDEQPVLCSLGGVHFVWDGVSSRAKITSIDGLTPDTDQQYRFNFWVVG